jgi:hypothetical protein
MIHRCEKCNDVILTQGLPESCFKQRISDAWNHGVMKSWLRQSGLEDRMREIVREEMTTNRGDRPMGETCGVCGDYVLWGKHRCSPIWLVELPEWNGGDPDRIRASDAQEAAEKFAERFDRASASYSVVSGESITVTVCDAHGKDEQKFVVEGESVPQYTARQTI